MPQHRPTSPSSPNLTLHPSSDNMDDSPQNVYVKCLPSDRGFPLWIPEPSSTLPSSHRQDGLQIGDVGFVSRRGTFDVLLNISYGPNHALHQRPGVSFSFHPTALDIDNEVDVLSNAVPPGYIITSSGITQPNQTSQRCFLHRKCRRNDTDS